MPAVLLGDEHELHAEVLTAHRADRVLRTDVLVVELQPTLVGQRLGDELVQRVQHHVEGVSVQADVRGHWFGSFHDASAFARARSVS